MADNVSALAVVPIADPTKLNAQDLSFLQSAQFSNLSEITEANIALANTSGVASREFADWMIGDHTAQSAQLTTIAKQLGVTLPTTLDPVDQAEASQLKTLTGTAFDTTYAADGAQGHAATVAALRQEVAGGENPTLVSLAEQILPGVQAHYEQASILAGLPDPGPGPAAPPPSPAPGTPATLSAQDQAFIQQAASGNAAEVAEGAVAVRVGNVQTAELGRWLAADHTSATYSLAALGQREGFAVPTALTAAQQSRLTSLQNTSPAAFEGTYASAQLTDQANVLMQFIKEAGTGTDAGLVSYAQSAVPVLEQHLAGAAELRLDSLGVAPAGGTATNFQSLITAAAPQAGKLLSDLGGTLPINGTSVLSALTSAQSGGALGADLQQIVHVAFPSITL